MLREETPGQSILYLYEPGSYAPLARVDQAEGEEQKVYYFHTDQIGKPLELTDSQGEIVWQATYRSWGAIEQMTVNDVEQNLRFQGQYWDAESASWRPLSRDRPNLTFIAMHQIHHRGWIHGAGWHFGSL
ncbi:RHS domain-containing protein [Pseudomonas sp. M2]|jgi:hypothetical protein|uniref:RHS repeat domain-containing protein n=1 Tax=Pseudomonas sp. M2 TaxID=228756 RepID=UPI001A1A298D|nr:hypothetical protein [Pseudomonas sp. M2]